MRPTSATLIMLRFSFMHRFGVYDVLKARLNPTTTQRNGKRESRIPAWKIAAAASVAGAAGGIAGNPAGEW